MKRAAWLFATLVACTSTSAAPKAVAKRGSSAPEDAMHKTPDDGGGTFVRGAAVKPATELAAWLDKQQRDGKPRLVRLPVVLKPGNVGFTTRGARVGAGDDALELYANDASLGVGLADRARKQCADKPQCAFWLDGYWRGKVDGGYQLDVVRVHAPIAADAIAAASHAEVEGESGN